MTQSVATTGMLIGGQWSAGQKTGTFDDYNPSTADVLARVADSSQDDVARAVESARAALPGWAGLPAAQRGRLMYRIAEDLEAAAELICHLETSDNGRPIRETAAQAGIVAKWFRYYAGMADKIEGTVIPVEGPYINYTRRVPVGVCAAITPWNHPMLIAAKKIAPALACGNTLVVKPSELAPLSVLEFARIATDAGLPPGVLNVVPGGPQTGRSLIAHPGIDRVDLTGSTRTGIAVATEAAKSLKRVGLELGGKAANVVFADADLARAVSGAVFAGFIAQGQSCVAGARVLVDRSIFDTFVQAMGEKMAAIQVGDPAREGTQMGPLITPAARDRTDSFVQQAVADGATLVQGGTTPELPAGLSPKGFYRPTLLVTEDPHSTIAQEEIFGPVVTAIPFATEDEAIAISNSVPFGLGAAVWTGDVSRAHRVANAVRAGIVWVNDYHRIDAASPWGGFGLSGYGRENGFAAVNEFTEVKSVWVPTEPQPMDWYDSADFGTRLN